MSYRQPILAGGFYPADPRVLTSSVDAWLSAGAQKAEQEGLVLASATMIMLPHAGHVYCGRIIGEKLATLHELQTQYSLEDCYDLLEILIIDRANEQAANEAMPRG